MGDAVVELLSISGFQSGAEWCGDTGGEPLPLRTWAECHAEIGRAWARPDLWQGEAGEAMSLVIIWRQGVTVQVLHWCGCFDVWEAICEDAEALRLYAAMGSIECPGLEVLH